MMMKKILVSIISLACLACSCTPVVGDLFEDSSAKRIEAEIERIKEILPDAPNGWLMEYFPEMSQSYGGYNLFLSFSPEMEVTAMSEATGKGKTATSSFSIKQSAGPVLSFDTYNEVLHYFSDPDDPAGIGGPGYGLEGDFEFLVLSATAEEVVLKGRKTGSVAVMTPFSPSMEWSDYLDDINKKRKELSDYYRLKYTNEDDETFELRLNRRYLEVYKYDDEGARYSEYYPFIVTLTGCRFYSPVVLGNEEIEGLILVPEMGEDGAFVPTNEASGIFVPSYPNLNELLITKNWFMARSGLSPYGQKLWDKAKEKLDAAGDKIIYCYLGMATNIQGTNYSFNFSSQKNGTGLLYFDYDYIGTDGISLQFSELGSYYGKEYYVNYGFNGVIDPIGNEKKRTFTLTTDDIKNPNWIKLTDKDDSENWFTVYRSTIYNPFEN